MNYKETSKILNYATEIVANRETEMWWQICDIHADLTITY